jgi:hypothetical protein
MAFDELLAERIRGRLGTKKGFTEKRMFGGIAFLLNANMCCGVHGDELIVRLDPERTDEALAGKHTRRFDLTGRPMKGWILVGPEALRADAEMDQWLALATAYAGSLPRK